MITVAKTLIICVTIVAVIKIITAPKEGEKKDAKNENK